MKKKAAVLALCFGLLLAQPEAVFAENIGGGGGTAAIKTTVPDSHTLTVEAENAGVAMGGVFAEAFEIDRLSEATLLIRPDVGYKVTAVTLNGVDITAQVVGGYYTVPPVYEDMVLVVETVESPANEDAVHDISGTVTDEDGNPIPDATVDIGGHTGVTDEDGNFVIEDVPEGFHPVTITDGNGDVIGYTEVEIGEGEAGVSENPDGSVTLSIPEGSAAGVTLVVTDEGGVLIENVTEITDESSQPQSSPGSSSSGSGNAGSSGSSGSSGSTSTVTDNQSPATGESIGIGAGVLILTAMAVVVRKRKNK